MLARFRALGVPTLSADEIAHGVMAAETEATSAIAARFGSSVLAPDGSVNREALGRVVFGDETARKELEAIVAEIMRLHGGRIDVDENEGGGAVFRLRFRRPA